MIFKNSVLLAIFSIFSVLLGIFRDRLLAVYVGVGPVLDVYNASFRIPDLSYGIFLAFITAGTVVPFLTKENKNGKLIESEKRFTSLLFFFSVLMIVVILIVIMSIGFYAHLIVPGFSKDQLQEFVFATRILMFQPLILGVSSLISCFAQLKNEFLFYGIAPLGYSLGIIFGIVFFYREHGVNGLIFGVLIGAVISLLIQSISLKAHNFSVRRHNISFVYVKELVYFAFPRSFTNVVTQLRVVFLTGFATTLGPGVLSSFLFAQRITDALAQITSQSITTASLPVLSREHEEGRIKEHEALVHKYTRILFFGAIAVSLMVYPFRHTIVAILYSHNQANNLISLFLVGFLIAMPFSMTSSYLAIGFYSMKDTKKVFLGNLVGSTVSVGICLFFKSLGIISLMYGVIGYYMVSSILYMILYKRSHFLLKQEKLCRS
jgi:putative peptidoglycan lipid II flippase